MPDADDAFRAIADPTRRRILDLLAGEDALTVGQIAEHFPDLVPSGISKHLMTLRSVGLVQSEKVGRHQLYRVDADAMVALFGPWVARYETFWGDALDRLRQLATDDDQP